MKISKVNWLVAIIAMCVMTNAKAEPETEKDELPSIEFLEFLGSFVNDKGQFVDPMMLRDANDDTPQVSEKEERNHD